MIESSVFFRLRDLDHEYHVDVKKCKKNLTSFPLRTFQVAPQKISFLLTPNLTFFVRIFFCQRNRIEENLPMKVAEFCKGKKIPIASFAIFV